MAPARIGVRIASEARELACAVAVKLNLVGLLAVEMFLRGDGKLLINELAPRPHNSGHWTIEGCVTSQFEQHVRAVCGLPLGATATSSPDGDGQPARRPLESWRTELVRRTRHPECASAPLRQARTPAEAQDGAPDRGRRNCRRGGGQRVARTGTTSFEVETEIELTGTPNERAHAIAHAVALLRARERLSPCRRRRFTASRLTHFPPKRW